MLAQTGGASGMEKLRQLGAGPLPAPALGGAEEPLRRGQQLQQREREAAALLLGVDLRGCGPGPPARCEVAEGGSTPP